MRFLVMLLAGFCLAAHAAITFTIKEHTHHTWTNELVTYTVKLPASQAKRVTLIGPEGKAVPVQVTPKGNGMAEVAFIVNVLPADGEVTYTLKNGKPVGKSIINRLYLNQKTQLFYSIDSGGFSVIFPSEQYIAGAQHFFPETLNQLALRLALCEIHRADGLALDGFLQGEMKILGMKQTLVAEGPIYGEFLTECRLEAGYYRLRTRVVKGQNAVLFREEFDNPKTAVGKAFMTFSLSTNYHPDRVSSAIRSWRKRTDPKTNALGDDYKLDFDAARKEMSILAYVNWWPETARRATFYNSANLDGDAISILPAQIGGWRNPMGMYVMTEPGGKVRLDLPLYIDQDWVRDGVEWGNPYYTGKLEAGWPRTAGRRSWVLHIDSQANVFPKEGRSSVLEAVRKYCDLPLDKVKDWTLDWPADPNVTYPRLYVEPGKLDGIRARVKDNPRWMKRFGQYMNRPISYTILEDQKIGDDLLHAKSHPSWNVPNDAQGSLESLRSFVDKVWEHGYMGFASPNNAAPMLELIKFDAAMSVATATPEEKAEMRDWDAVVANMVYDEDWHSTKSGVHRGNPNMPPRQEHHLGVASCVLPDHPLAAAWRARGEAEAIRELDDLVREAGTWRECPHYQYEAAMYPLFQSAVPIAFNGGQNIFQHPKMKATWDYLLNISTPPDPRFGTRLVPAFGNGSWEQAPLFGWLANLTKQDDPAFSKRMQWMWIEQGRPDWMAFSETLLDPALPTEQPSLTSMNYPGFGAILRSGFPSKEEAWVAFRAGDNIEHYDYGDQNSFMFYAKGAPLVIQFGSQYQPAYRGAWYFNRVSIGHREVKPGLFGGTEFASAAGNEDYAARMTGFAMLGAVDTATSQHVTDREGLVPDDKNVPMPPNFPMDPYPVPRRTWTRTMALVRSFTADGAEDPTGPVYLVLRDSLAGENPLASEWNLWLLADTLDTAANPVRAAGPHGVDLDIFLAEPAQPKWFTSEDSHTFLAGPTQESWQKMNPGKPWKETLKNLRAHAASGGGYLAILFPRKADEAPPLFNTLLDGKGVYVTHARGADVVIMSEKPVAWVEGDRRFSGTQGIIRLEGDALTLTLLAGGEIAAGKLTLKATTPASLTLRGGKMTLITDGPAQTVAVNGKMVEVAAGKQKVGVK
ncbi:MAG: hypothetical protein BWY76_00533 [bacterium ADurb.Bin429]|nr:MAG: hypothetical protein BWY76_00533 [bacterium ADurb.Bin429]